MNEKKVIAVTGGIASGKSLCLQYFSSIGAEVFSMDHITTALLQPQSVIYQDLFKHFRSCIDSHGNIMRTSLANEVFQDDKKLAILNALMHPHIRKIYETKITTFLKNDTSNHTAQQYDLDRANTETHHITQTKQILVAEIPLMIEALIHQSYRYYNNYTIVIQTNYAERLKRALHRNNMTLEKFYDIDRRQLNDETRAQYADCIIYNNSTIADVFQQLQKIKDGGFKRNSA